MSREHMGISFSTFERLYHNHQRTTLLSEIRQCFDYFEHHSPGKAAGEKLTLIHGSKVELRRVEEGKGFAVEMDGGLKTLGVDIISKQEQLEIVKRIRGITFPYADFVANKHKKLHSHSG